MQRTERFIEINAPVERVFDLFSDFESFPRWMKNIREVRRTGRRYTRWAADAPLGSSVEWEAQITAFEPDRRIAWQSVRGDINTDGEVVFQESRRGT
ncbi:MAG TPA: SRPBCC family protein, partial [Pyrinomonadaceae bacterium]